MSPENFNKQATETSEVKKTSEALTNKEKTAEDDVQKWANETHLETLSEGEKLANELLKDSRFSELSDDEKEKIYQKALGLIEEAEMIGLPTSLEQLKEEFKTVESESKTVSVVSEFTKRDIELTEKNTPLKEKLLILQKEFVGQELPENVIASLDKALAVANFVENDKTITKEEKDLIQTKLGSADLFSPGGFETAMYAVYEDESISEETREKLIQVSGVVNIPQRDITTPDDLTDDLKNRNKARDKQFTKLKKQEKTLTKEKEKLEAIPESERTDEQKEELKELEKQLKTVKTQKEYFDKSNRGTVTRRQLPIGGTAELSEEGWFPQTIFELVGKRVPLSRFAKKQNQEITCMYATEHLENGKGKRTPLNMGEFVFGKIENGKPIGKDQAENTQILMTDMGIGKDGEIITEQKLDELGDVFHLIRNPKSPKNKDGARQDLIDLGLLKEGEKKLSSEGIRKLGEMIRFIRNNPKLPPNYENMHEYLKDKFGKKKDDTEEE